MSLDPKTQDRLRRKIARAYRNVERLPERSNRRLYWWRVAQKLQHKLHGGPLTIRVEDINAPSRDVTEMLEQLQADLARDLGFPKRYLMGFDLASAPDRTLVMHHVQGRFLLAEELTKNPPY
jgi:hypothetical protein